MPSSEELPPTCRPPVGTPAPGPDRAAALWRVRRRRAVRWAATGRDPSSQSNGGISVVILDMGGVVIPTLFESVALSGFPAGPLGVDEQYERVERGDLPERSYWS